MWICRLIFKDAVTLIFVACVSRGDEGLWIFTFDKKARWRNLGFKVDNLATDRRWLEGLFLFQEFADYFERQKRKSKTKDSKNNATDSYTTDVDPYAEII